jgi:hypothetical protein
MGATLLVAPFLLGGTVITQPDGLAPNSYRLAFVTSVGRDALSGNISDYNTFVTNVANTVPALAQFQWRAIVSTATVDARDNIGGVDSTPIYNLAGQLVAKGTSELWSGFLRNPIFVTELGDAPPNPFQVWTGTNIDGTKDAKNPAGTPGFTMIGSANHDNPPWIHNILKPSAEFRLIYAISIPEPSSAALLLSGAVLLLLAGRWRHQL